VSKKTSCNNAIASSASPKVLRVAKGITKSCEGKRPEQRELGQGRLSVTQIGDGTVVIGRWAKDGEGVEERKLQHVMPHIFTGFV